MDLSGPVCTTRWTAGAGVQVLQTQPRTLRLVHAVISTIDYTTSKTIKLMQGQAPGKHSLYEKTAASVLLKLFISGNE